MTSAIALLVVMSIITTSMTKPLKELWVPHLLPKNPFLKVKFLIILYIKLHFLYIKSDLNRVCESKLRHQGCSSLRFIVMRFAASFFLLSTLSRYCCVVEMFLCPTSSFTVLTSVPA